MVGMNTISFGQVLKSSHPEDSLFGNRVTQQTEVQKGNNKKLQLVDQNQRLMFHSGANVKVWIDGKLVLDDYTKDGVTDLTIEEQLDSNSEIVVKVGKHKTSYGDFKSKKTVLRLTDLIGESVLIPIGDQRSFLGRGRICP